MDIRNSVHFLWKNEAVTLHNIRFYKIFLRKNIDQGMFFSENQEKWLFSFHKVLSL